MPDKIELYSDRTRIRVCGILIERNAVLMVKHDGLGKKGFLWIPPGGGIHFGNSLEANLEREFREETGLQIKSGDQLFIHEFISPPLHAIEIFFNVRKTSGKLHVGTDPELSPDNQMISDVRFMEFGEINKLEKDVKHQIFWYSSDINELLKLRGYFKIENNSIK